MYAAAVVHLWFSKQSIERANNTAAFLSTNKQALCSTFQVSDKTPLLFPMTSDFWDKENVAQVCE